VAAVNPSPSKAAEPTAFDLLELEPEFDLDSTELEARLFAESTRWHPDRYALAPAADRLAAEDYMALINDAHRLLQDPLQRAELLLRMAAVPPTEGTDRDADPEFLLRMMEISEAADLAMKALPAEPDRAIALKDDLHAQEKKLLGAFGESWARMHASHGFDLKAHPDLATLHRIYYELRYLRRTLDQLHEALCPLL
jgi:molecular chaperone HscB